MGKFFSPLNARAVCLTNQCKVFLSNQAQTKSKRKLGPRLFPRMAPIARFTTTPDWLTAVSRGALRLTRCILASTSHGETAEHVV